MQELGYGLTLEHDAAGAPIEADSLYRYEIEHGPVKLPSPTSAALLLRGKTLLDLAQDDYSDARSLAEAKPLMRTLIAHYTGGKELESRKIFKELQEL